MKTEIKNRLVLVISCLLIILWIYAATSKLLQFDAHRSQMMEQAFPTSINLVLVWAVPLIELLAALLLAIHRTLLPGLFLSVILLISFSLYISLALSGVLGTIPCSCGGAISSFTWGQHLVFNLLFLLLAMSALVFRAEQEGTFRAKNIICK